MTASHIVPTASTPVQHFPELNFAQLKYESKPLAKTPANVVYKGTYGEQRVVIKMLRSSEHKQNSKHASEAKLRHDNERAIIARFDPPCPYIVRSIGWCLTPACLVTEWMPNGDLFDALIERTNWSINARLQVGYDIAAALHYIHGHNLVYGDIKAENILFYNADKALLADFDLTHPESEKMASGTPEYLAPEVFLTFTTTKQTDIYSYGILLLELVLKKTFAQEEKISRLCSKTALQQRQQSLKKEIKKAPCSTEIQNLITDCIAWEPEKRPSTLQIMTRLSEIPGAKLKLAASHPQPIPIPSVLPTANNPAAVKDSAPVPLPPNNLVSALQQLRL